LNNFFSRKRSVQNASPDPADSRKEMKRKRMWIVQQPRAALTKTQLRDRAKKAFKSGAGAADRAI